MSQFTKKHKKIELFKKIYCFLLLVFLCFSWFAPFTIFAQNAENKPTETSIQKEGEQKGSAKSAVEITPIPINLPDLGPTDLTHLAHNIFNLLLMLASVVATAFIIFAGYKYITSAGDTEKAAQAKNQILGVVIGLIIIAASWAIVSFVDHLLEGRLRGISFQLTEPKINTNSITQDTQSSSTGQSPTSPGEETTRGTAPGETSSSDTTPETRSSDAAITPSINPQEPKPAIAKIDNCPYSQEAFDKCFAIDSGMFACYKNANSFLTPGNLCDTADLNAKAQQACQSLKATHQFLGENFDASQTATICGTVVSSTMEQCLIGSPSDPNSCTKKVSSYVSTIKAGVIRETITRERTISPYQQCIKNAREQYTECKSTERALCSAQRTAYESCLRGLGLIIERLCEKARKLYYDCHNSLYRQCQKAYSMQLEYCRIHYRTYY